jgi:phosphoribosyl 1,2-cyclic phosphodiesterase
MKLTVWGARGSIPVSGPEYLRYGGDTTCLELATKKGETIILDAGTGLRRLGIELLKRKPKMIDFLLTHCHWDHLMGFPFFKPLYKKGVTIRIHGCTYAQESVKSIFQETMRAPYFPVDFNDISGELEFDNKCLPAFQVGSLCCASVPLSHPNNGYGFVFHEGEKRVAFFPDNDPMYPHKGALKYEDFVERLKGVDILIHDGEYTREEYESFSKGWGHSVYLDTVALAEDAGVKKLILWHVNQERTDDQADEMLAAARKAGGAELEVDMARVGMTLEV